MKKLIFSLLLTIGSLATTHAQTKSQVLNEIKYTLEDFCSDLNGLNDDQQNFEQIINAIADNFGSPEYFLRNGKQMESFSKWLQTYYGTLLQRQSIQHNIVILERTFRKVNTNTDSDKRYMVEVEWCRKRMEDDNKENFPENKLSFTVVWNGMDRYVTILGIDGEISTIPKTDGMYKDLIAEALKYIDSDNPRKALEILNPLGDNGNIDAINAAANIYMYGPLEIRDEIMAIAKWAWAAELDDPLAMNQLGRCFMLGKGLSQNKEKGYDWFLLAAEKDFAPAQANIGRCYLNGDGVQQDYIKALEWNRKAAKQNNAFGLHNLGTQYLFGWGVEKDENKAYEYFERAANLGHDLSMYNMAARFWNSSRNKQNDEKAFYWAKLSADKGNAVSCKLVGLCYITGRGVTQNDKLGADYFRKAAVKGDAVGQFNLGICYDEGRGVTQDDNLAYQWYSKSAQQGYAKAQYNLAAFYELGRHVPKDYNKAHFWYTKAAEQNFTPAIEALKRFTPIK